VSDDHSDSAPADTTSPGRRRVPAAAVSEGHGDSAAWSLLTAAPWAIIVVAAEGAVVHASDRAADLLGCPLAELVGHDVAVLLAERRVAHRTGEPPLPLEVVRHPLTFGDEVFEVLFIEATTTRLGAEEQLAAAERALAVMEARQRIARDLHDTVIQRLFGVGLTLQALMVALGEPVKGRVQSVIDGLNETIEQLRAAIVPPPPHESSEPG
jgi:signal transduction histidine kinase